MKRSKKESIQSVFTFSFFRVFILFMPFKEKISILIALSNSCTFIHLLEQVFESIEKCWLFFLSFPLILPFILYFNFEVFLFVKFKWIIYSNIFCNFNFFFFSFPDVVKDACISMELRLLLEMLAIQLVSMRKIFYVFIKKN